MRAKYFFYLTFFILLNVNFGSTQIDKVNPEKFIKEVQAKYSSFNNIVIDFTQEISTITISDKQIIKGKIYIAKPNSYRLELPNQLIICDGEDVYNYRKKLKQVVIARNEKDFFSPQNLLVEIPNFSKIVFDGEENIDNKKTFKFSIFPTRSNPEFKSLKLWIDENKIIWKIQTEDWAGNNYSFLVQSFNFNQELKNDFFKFKIPAGVKVVDLR